MFSVYALHDPRTSAIRYVGCTEGSSRYVRSRVHGHCAAARAGKTPPVAAWVRELIVAGVRPAFSVLETCDDRAAASDAECRWIAKLRAEGVALTNVNPGGLGRPRPYRHVLYEDRGWSDERRARQMAAFAKRIRGGVVQVAAAEGSR